ncbi:DNA-binding NarL/FixJ family response regulator [Luteibacter sp. HA06]|jgi:DNA-binding NarL/FixJ family response regulator
MPENDPIIRVLVVDDHPLMRSGIVAVVDRESDMTVVGEVGDGESALARYDALRPDVTLMDLQMPGMGGVETIARLRKRHADAAIVVLTTYKGDVQALKAIRAGAGGYLLKSAVRTELVDTIRSVRGGRPYILPEVAADIAAHLIDETLTERETAVLACVAGGNSNRAVAQELGVTEDTIKAHMSNVLAKLKAQDRTHAVTIAVRRGIIEP